MSARTKGVHQTPTLTSAEGVHAVYAPVRVPVAPLVEAVRSRGVQIGRSHPVGRTYWRATARGSITLDSADEVAVRLLGLHPASVWPEWFELAR